MSDTLVEDPVVAETAASPAPARSFGKGAIAGIIVGAVIVIAAAFGGGFLVGSGANAGSLGSSSTSQQGPGGFVGGSQTGQGGPGGQSGQLGTPPGGAPGNGAQNGPTNNQNG